MFEKNRQFQQFTTELARRGIEVRFGPSGKLKSKRYDDMAITRFYRMDNGKLITSGVVIDYEANNARDGDGYAFFPESPNAGIVDDAEMILMLCKSRYLKGEDQS